MLKEYIEQTKAEIKKDKSKTPDQKKAKYLKTAEKILEEVQLEKDTFI